MAEKGSSNGGIIGTVIGTLAAIAGGFAFGSFGIKGGGTVADAAAPPAKAPAAKAAEVRPLAPIVTNLRDPSTLYVRVEAVVVFEPNTPDSAALAAKIGDDLVSYLRTVSLSELDGPTGFQYVREDLRKRSIQLGAGKVRELLLQSFVIQ
jgi:flagellar protein FliL